MLLLMPLFVLTSGALFTASSMPPASAACSGAGNPVTPGALRQLRSARRGRVGGVSGNDLRQQFRVPQSRPRPDHDGSCAYAFYLEPFAYYAAQGTSCTTGSWSFYSYTDTVGSNSVMVSVRPSYLSDIWNTSYGY
jgi:hypothetical protein